jgi:hypothetical protein
MLLSRLLLLLDLIDSSAYSLYGDFPFWRWGWGEGEKKERRERREKRRHTIEHDLAKIGSLKNLQDRL